MTTEAEHRKAIKNLLEDIREKMRGDLLVERQKLIGFSSSEVSCNLLALLLHRKNVISPGFNVNHRYFVSERTAMEKLDFEFPGKRKLVTLLVRQEHYRNMLCYGKSRERDEVEASVRNMLEIKKTVEKHLGEEL